MELREHVLNHVLQTITFFFVLQKIPESSHSDSSVQVQRKCLLKHSLISLFW